MTYASPLCNKIYETESNIHFALSRVTFHDVAKTIMKWTPGQLLQLVLKNEKLKSKIWMLELSP